MVKFFEININEIQPSQLYLNKKKIQSLLKKKPSLNPKNLQPIPIKKLGEKKIFVDGHTRAYLLWKKGFKKGIAYWEYEELDWNLYRNCVEWCLNAGIERISDLKSRIISDNVYQKKWISRCQNVQKKLNKNI